MGHRPMHSAKHGHQEKNGFTAKGPRWCRNMLRLPPVEYKAKYVRDAKAETYTMQPPQHQNRQTGSAYHEVYEVRIPKGETDGS